MSVATPSPSAQPRFVPGPEELLIIDEGPQAPDAPIGILQSLIDEHGDFFQYRTTFGDFYFVNEPSLVRDVLCNHDFVRNRLLKSVLGNGVLSTDGEYWEQQRRLMLPLFTPQQIRRIVDTLYQVCDERLRVVDSHLPTNDPLDLTREIFRIALANIGRTLLGAEFDDSFLDGFDVVMREIAAVQNASIFGLPLVRTPETNRQNKWGLEIVDTAARSLIESQRDGSPLSKLLSALRAHGRDGTGKPLTVDQLRDEVLTIITAGHETTAVAMCWLLHNIAAHPEVAERLTREVDDLLGQRPVTADDLPKLEYSRMVIDETLRLYPPVWIVARTAARDAELQGCRIPKGSGVLICPYALHRHPDHWDDPGRFDPDRFATGAPGIEPYAYIPFLAGRHLCLGKHFSLTEMLVVVATIAQRYHLSVSCERPPANEPLVSLRMDGGLHLRLERRVPEAAAW